MCFYIKTIQWNKWSFTREWCYKKKIQCIIFVSLKENWFQISFFVFYTFFVYNLTTQSHYVWLGFLFLHLLIFMSLARFVIIIEVFFCDIYFLNLCPGIFHIYLVLWIMKKNYILSFKMLNYTLYGVQYGVFFLQMKVFIIILIEKSKVQYCKCTLLKYMIQIESY